MSAAEDHPGYGHCDNPGHGLSEHWQHVSCIDFVPVVDEVPA